MKSSIDRLLDRGLKVHASERRKVALMALYAANAIGAVVVGRTVRDTLFLASRTTADLPFVYIVSSVAVALMSWGYARFADRIRRDRLNTLVAGGWAAAMILFWISAHLSAPTTAPVLYVAVEAMGSLVVIQFWTFAQDVFTSREAKRLFPIISAGGQAANVFYGFLASSLSKRVSAESLLILCAINLAACAFLARYIATTVGVSADPTPARNRAAERAAPKGQASRALATPHLVALAVIGLLSAIAVNLVDYQFKAAAETRFTKEAANSLLSVDKHALGAFFGRFYGICGALAFALQIGLTGRLLERFGVMSALLPLPICLMLGSLGAWWFPAPWTSSLAKGSDSIFRYTINDASMQLLYVPVPAYQRGRAKALIDGILRPLAGVAAGFLLVLLGEGPFHRRWPTGLTAQQIAPPDGLTTIIILVLCVGWIFYLWRDRRLYLDSLMETLQKRRLDPSYAAINADQFATETFAKVLKSNDALAILYALELLQHMPGRDFGPLVAQLLDHRISSVRAAAADHLAMKADKRYAAKLRHLLNDKDPWCVASAIGAICALEQEAAMPLVQPFLKDPRPAMRAAAVIGLVRHCGVNGIVEAAEELKRLINVNNTVEKDLAASVLGALRLPTFNKALLRLLDDPEPTVRRAALDAAGKLKSPELVAPIVKLLARRQLGREAAQALAAFGPGIEIQLAAVIRDDTQAHEIRRVALTVLGRVGTPESAEILDACLELFDPILRTTAARSLARVMRRRKDVVVRRPIVIHALEFEIANAERCADVQVGLHLPKIDRSLRINASHGAGGPILLTLALEEERDNSIQRAIVLLELLYPGAGLDVVADNLKSDVPARRANAVEVLDNTFQEELKKRLLALVEDRRTSPPPPARSRGEWLSELVDGPHPWIAACAAELALEQHVTGVEPSLLRGVKSPVPYVRESCAHSLIGLAPAEARTALLPLREDPARTVRRLVTEYFAPTLPATG
jgi:ATP/ADP translocase/HEAT repeat protein